MKNYPTYFAFILFVVFTQSNLYGQERGLQPEDYFHFQFLSDPQISPDGSKVVFVRSIVNDERRSRESSLWIVPADGNSEPRAFTFGKNDRSPRWSPDGKQIGFIANRDDETKIWSIPLDGGEAQPLFETDHNIIGFEWSPDGSRLLLQLSKESDELKTKTEADIQVITTSLYKANGVGILPPRRTHLWTYHIKTRQLQPLTWSTDWNASGASFSPDGSTVIFEANMDGDEYEGGFNRDLFTIPADSGDVRKLTSSNARSSSAVWSNSGNKIAFTQTEGRYEPAYIFIYDFETDEKRNIHPKLDYEISNLKWSSNDSGLIFEAAVEGKNLPVYLDIEQKTTAYIMDGSFSISSVMISGDGDRMVFLKNDEVSLSEIWISDESGNNKQPLSKLNKSFLDSLKLKRLETFWFENESGNQSQGFLLKPIDWEPGESYPLVLNIKGGPAGMWGHQWFHEFQMMAARGYAVFFTNYRGSTGYGFAHRSEVFQDYGGADYRDNIDGLNAVLDQNDWIDRNRLYITGGSHGGFLTNWITAHHPEKFRAAVTQRSVSNWISEAGTQSYVPQAMREEFGGTIWENFDLYWNRSPLKYADQVKTPTLIIHSDRDEITPIGQAEEWYYALKINNVPVEMVIFQGENHNLSRTGTPVNLVERLTRIINWFEKFE